MSEDLVRVAPSDARLALPRLIVDAGPVAVARFLEFFAARIANRRTRAAYGRAVGQFLAWCAARGLVLTAVSPLHVAAYIRYWQAREISRLAAAPDFPFDPDLLPHLDTPPARTLSQSSVQENSRAQEAEWCLSVRQHHHLAQEP